MSIKNVVKIALFIINVGLCAQRYPDLYRVAEITIPEMWYHAISENAFNDVSCEGIYSS